MGYGESLGAEDRFKPLRLDSQKNLVKKRLEQRR